MKRLSLKTEHLADLSPEELGAVAGGAWSGQVGCIVSIAPCLTIAACTALCATIGETS